MGQRVASTLGVGLFMFAQLTRGIARGTFDHWLQVAFLCILFFSVDYARSFASVTHFVDWIGVSLFIVTYFYLISISFRSWNELSEVEQDIEYASHRYGIKRRQRIARDKDQPVIQSFGVMVVLVLTVTLAFYFSTYLWQRLEPEILAGDDKSPLKIAVFVADLFLRGALLDVMEHFKLQVGALRINQDLWLYKVYAFTYRAYVAFFIIATIMRYLRVMYGLRKMREDDQQ
jgi:hypothetical protein